MGWERGRGREGTGLGGPLAQTPPLRSLASPSPAGRPLTRLRRPRSRRRAAPGSRLPGRVCSVRSRCSDSSSRRRRRRRQGPGTGARRHFRRPLRSTPPAGGDVTATRGTGGTRRGRPGPPPSGCARAPPGAGVPESPATWARPPPPARTPRGRLGYRSRPRPHRASRRRAGPGLAELPGGDGMGVAKGPPPPLGVPQRLWGTAPTPHTTSRPSPGPGDKAARTPSAQSPRPESATRSPSARDPAPGASLRPPLGLSLPSDLLSPRGLGAAARDVQTQLSAEPETRELRLDNQEPRPVRGRRRPGGTGMEAPRGSRDTHKMGPLSGRGRARVRGARGAECLEWEAGRGLRQDFAVKEGGREEREEEGAERSPLRAGGERDTGGKRP